VTATLRERLLSRLIIDPDTGCLLWTGTKNRQGYGLIKSGGRRLMAHRVMYELFAEPIPDGLQIDHLCRVKACANVAHLEAVTCRENLMRAPTLQAANAAKTHCDQNHEFTSENTRVRPEGRQCRACQRESDRRYRQGKRGTR
jgi:hypothetical protein